MIAGPDYFTFLRDIIKNCEFDYALVCHDDVYLPFDIKDKVKNCIERIEGKYGDKWGVAGNAGLEYLSNGVVRYIKDPHTIVSSPTSSPVPVVSIDGNILLVNIKNLKKKKVTIPKELKGFHFYDLALLAECYRHGLVSVVDPNLYVVHNSGGNQGAFDYEAKTGTFKDYWKKYFINNALIAINGVVQIENTLDYLDRNTKDNRQDFYKVVGDMIEKTQKKSQINLFIIVRTQLKRTNFLDRVLDSCLIADSYNSPEIKMEVKLAVNNTGLTDEENKKIVEKIKKDYKQLSISAVFTKKDGKQFPRVKAIKDALQTISGKDNYVWIVDDDDFIFPKAVESLKNMFEEGRIILGDIVRFDEKWGKEGKNSFPLESIARHGHYLTNLYYKGFIHDNYAPINAFIFPFDVLNKVFSEYKLLGDYYEDYAISLAAQHYANVRYYPLSIAGVSFHGEDTQTVLLKDRTHWDISLATFMSELVSKGLLKSWEYDFYSEYQQVTGQNKRWQPIFRLARPVIKVSKKLKIIK